jgi:pimeloyl-ACP methyl ester carboxylesterase
MEAGDEAMNAPRRIAGILGALVVALVTTAGAQQPESAVFFVRLGHDTLAAEIVSFTNGRADGDLRYRTPVARVQRAIKLSPTFELQRLDLTSGSGARGEVGTTHSVITVRGDSADISSGLTPPPTPSQTRSFALPRGTVPFNNLSGLTLELVLRRARVIGGDTVMVPMLIAPGQVMSVRVTRAGADSAVMSIAGVDIRARTDAVGRFLGATIPSQGAFFDRAPGGTPIPSWAPDIVSYDAPAGAPYTAESIIVHTPAGIALAGTLTIPSHRTGSRLPAVVLITGSGSQDRDEAAPVVSKNYRPFREIADTLSRRGIAVLRLDDRGVGGSSMGLPTATSADFADDIRAALALLRTRADIDPARLGLVGHSEGGIIGPMIGATDTSVHALVIIAGTAKTGRAISSFQRRYLIEHSAVVAPDKRDSVMMVSDHEVEKLFATPGWWRFFADYDPLPTAKRVKAPTLILQGETDTQVTPEQANMIAAAMRAGGNRSVTVRTFPRMNHLMLEDPSGDPSGYKTLSSYTVRRDFLGALADWLARTL